MGTYNNSITIQTFPSSEHRREIPNDLSVVQLLGEPRQHNVRRADLHTGAAGAEAGAES